MGSGERSFFRKLHLLIVTVCGISNCDSRMASVIASLECACLPVSYVPPRICKHFSRPLHRLIFLGFAVKEPGLEYQQCSEICRWRLPIDCFGKEQECCPLSTIGRLHNGKRAGKGHGTRTSELGIEIGGRYLMPLISPLQSSTRHLRKVPRLPFGGGKLGGCVSPTANCNSP